MRSRILLPIGLLLGSVLLLSGLAVGAQAPPPAPGAAPAADDSVLTVASEGKTLKLGALDLAKLPRQKVEAEDRGKESTYEGVALAELLRLAGGVPLGESFQHHDPPTWYVVVEAKDGYRALFALPELDPAFSDKVVLLAYRKDGKPLSDEEGPLRLVVPGEKRHARWARQVTGLRVGRL